MKCYAILPSSSAAARFVRATWLDLASGVLLVQDTDYQSFCLAVAAVGGTALPYLYDSSAISSDVVAKLAPISLSAGAGTLQLAQAAGAMHPAFGL